MITALLLACQAPRSGMIIRPAWMVAITNHPLFHPAIQRMRVRVTAVQPPPSRLYTHERRKRPESWNRIGRISAQLRRVHPPIGDFGNRNPCLPPPTSLNACVINPVTTREQVREQAVSPAVPFGGPCPFLGEVACQKPIKKTM